MQTLFFGEECRWDRTIFSMAVVASFDRLRCGNVPFYYKPEARERILYKYVRAAPDGYLVTGEVERASWWGIEDFSPRFPHSAASQKPKGSP